MSEPKYAHRFPPCPLYDLERLESWLEDLAKQGLILTHGGLFCGFAEFEKGNPKPMRYRLQPLPKKKFLEDRRPADAALEFAEEYGWEYLCNLGDYAVYGCDDPNARELDTDPQVQAIGLQQLYRRKRNEFLAMTVLILFSLLQGLWLGPVYDILQSRFYHSFYYLVVIITYPVITISELKQLHALRQSLRMGLPPSRTKNWKQNRWKHRLSAGFYVCILIYILTASFISRIGNWENSRWQSLDTYVQEIPFATMKDLAGGGVFEPDGMYTDIDNHIAERRTLLAPRQINLQQLGAVVQDGSTKMDGILEIDYYELRNDLLAKELFWEIQKKDRGSKYYHALELPDLPTEQEYAYSNHFPTLLLQEGNIVMRVELTQFDHGQQLTLAQWSAIFADSLLP